MFSSLTKTARHAFNNYSNLFLALLRDKAHGYRRGSHVHGAITRTRSCAIYARLARKLHVLNGSRSIAYSSRKQCHQRYSTSYRRFCRPNELWMWRYLTSRFFRERLSAPTLLLASPEHARHRH